MHSASNYVGRASQPLELLPLAARTASGTGDALTDLGGFNQISLQLDVTATATDAGDKLNVYVETTIDGVNWVPIVHFTELLGNGGAKRYYSKIVSELALTEFEAAASFTAASVRHLFGDKYRVSWTIDDASTDNASFTFGVTAIFK